MGLSRVRLLVLISIKDQWTGITVITMQQKSGLKTLFWTYATRAEGGFWNVFPVTIFEL